MDTKLKELIINEVTEEKLKELKDANAIPPNELFVTEDEDDALIIDKVLDANSENPITNAAVAQKFIEVDNKFTEITPSTTFAETERQKSINKFDGKLMSGCYASDTGAYVSASHYVCSENYINVKPNTKIHLTFDTSIKVVLKNTGFAFYKDKIFLGAHDGAFETTVPAEANQMLFSINTETIPTVEQFSNIVVTEHGAIVHEKDAPVVFAEAERQKSKNLFNDTFELGFYDISNGQPTASSSYKRTATKMPVKPNTQYTFSTSVSNPAQVLVFYDASMNFISYEGMSEYTTYTFTTPSNAHYFTYYTQAVAEANIQIEEGTIATDYQPYSGAITHNGDDSVVFAETERQKSKNLFNINANPDWLQGCTLSRTEDTLTFNTTSSNGKFGYKISGLTVGKQYTVSVQDISYANSLGLHIDYSSNSDTANFGRVTTTNKSVTFTASADFVYIKGYASYDSGNTMIVKKLQLEEGTIVTDYQPYSGAIVHENNTIFERAENKIRSFIETTDPEKYLSMQALTEFNRYGYRYNFNGETADELLNWIQNSAPQGFYTFYWSHGTVNGVEVMKASSQYAQVRVVYYFTPEYQVNKLEAGRWSGWKNISGV